MAKITTDVDVQGRRVATVVLSERNLLSLLAKLHTRGATPTITSTDPNGGVHLIVAQTDRVHYADPDRGGAGTPGPMHPVIESIVAQLRAAPGADS